jgi:hypothetical protein
LPLKTGGYLLLFLLTSGIRPQATILLSHQATTRTCIEPKANRRLLSNIPHPRLQHTACSQLPPRHRKQAYIFSSFPSLSSRFTCCISQQRTYPDVNIPHGATKMTFIENRRTSSPHASSSKPPSPQPTQCRHPSKTHSQAWPTLMILLLTFHALNLPDLATVDCRRIACHCLSVLAANRIGAEREGRHGYCGWVLAYDGVVIAKDDE